MKIRMKQNLFGPSVELRVGMETEQFDEAECHRLTEAGYAEVVVSPESTAEVKTSGHKKQAKRQSKA